MCCVSAAAHPHSLRCQILLFLPHPPPPPLSPPDGGSLLPRWVSVLQNSKDEALSNAFKGEPNGGGAAAGGGADGGVQELTKLVISEVKNMPGNKQCCDCGAPGRSGLGVSPPPLPRPGVGWVPGEGGGCSIPRGWVGMLSPGIAPPCRPYVALHQPGHPDVYRVLRHPSGAGRALFPHPVPHPGCPQHLRAAGKCLPEILPPPGIALWLPNLLRCRVHPSSSIPSVPSLLQRSQTCLSFPSGSLQPPAWGSG